MGWGTLAGKIAEQFQGRIERLKNEKRKLENEQKDLFKKPDSEYKRDRTAAIDTRLREISGLLAAKASD